MNNKIISHYKIIEKLGEGGMGEVYLAEDTKLKRKVALKFLPTEFTKDRDAVERFQREAQAAAALNHPNIVTIHEIDEYEDQTYIAMEHVEGETLKEKIASSPQPPAQIIDISLQICAGLSAAHEAGIVHRDIKPQNILINKEGRVKILDFGLAKLKGVSQLTSEKSTLGTTHYLSPEQALGKEVDHRTDIWSLGVILYEMLTGQLPFKGDYEQAVIYSILNEKPEYTLEKRPDLPLVLDKIIIKTLSKKPSDRYQDCTDLAEDLRKSERPGESELSRSESLPKPQKRTRIISLIAISIMMVLIVVGLGILTKKQPTPTPKESAELKSIAVLPFANMSPDKENEYFCDGMAEELLNRLAKLPALRVPARTSSFAFKGKNISVAEIGKALKVSTILEGSVRKYGDRLKITAQLIKVSDGYHLWSDTYNRDMKDLFKVQEEIALAIVEALKVKLGMEERDGLRSRGTDSLRAYDAYQKGLFFWNKRTGKDMERAISFFEEAIKNDPEYALAHSGLADCYNLLTFYAEAPPKETFPRAKAAALKALEIDPQLAEAHNSLAYVLYRYDWKWKAAEKEFKRSIQLNPNYSAAHCWYGEFLMIHERFGEAIKEIKLALDLNPVSLITNALLGLTYFYSGQTEPAIMQLKKTLELNPNFALAHYMLGMIYSRINRFSESFVELNKATELSRSSLYYVTELGTAYALAGKSEKTREILNRLKLQSEYQYISPFWMAVLHAALKEKDTALKFLEQAYEERHELLIFIKLKGFFDPIFSGTEINELIKRIGLEK